MVVGPVRSASDAEEQEHARAEALDSKLKELQERFRQTDEVSIGSACRGRLLSAADWS